ncbi:hypothetical protein Tco_1286419, partial [Tanacetum coccineum]
VPDVEGSNECKCELTRTPYGRRFINEELNSYMEFLFNLIVARGPRVGLNVTLNRYDFFHGHLFIAAEMEVLVCLFHAKEYPAYDKEVFPYNMGYCQQGVLVVLDAVQMVSILSRYHPKTIVISGSRSDVNYLNVGSEEPDYQIFIC